MNPLKLEILEKAGRAQDAINFILALQQAGQELDKLEKPWDREQEYKWVKQNKPEIWAKRLTDQELDKIYK